eukprot:scaffold190376_cov35-Tisochrysis_lutea.AAC.3
MGGAPVSVHHQQPPEERRKEGSSFTKDGSRAPSDRRAHPSFCEVAEVYPIKRRGLAVERALQLDNGPLRVPFGPPERQHPRSGHAFPAAARKRGGRESQRAASAERRPHTTTGRVRLRLPLGARMPVRHRYY